MPGDDPEATPAQAAWDKLGFCGCGDPEDVMALFRDALAGLAARWDGDPGDSGPELAVLPLDDPRALLVRYALDAAGLAEHGGSVFGCWPSDEGRRLLEFLRETPREEWFGAA